MDETVPNHFIQRGIGAQGLPRVQIIEIAETPAPIVNFWARLDDNFGETAGIAEMLLQSHTGEIKILPVLPKGGLAGAVRRLRTRVAVEGFLWSGILAGFTILLLSDSQLRLDDKEYSI